MLVVPLNPVASQTLSVQLGGAYWTINVYQKSTGLYLDLFQSASTTPTLSGVLCRDAVRLVRDAYLGFVGDLAFFDTQGDADPYYTGLGSRWFLAYLAPGESVDVVAAEVAAFMAWTTLIGVGDGSIIGIGDGSVLGL